MIRALQITALFCAFSLPATAGQEGERDYFMLYAMPDLVFKYDIEKDEVVSTVKTRHGVIHDRTLSHEEKELFFVTAKQAHVEVLDIAKYIFENVQISEYAQQYKVRLIRNTRPHRVMGRAARTVKEYIRVGVSPRVHFHLEAVARTFAFFNGDMVITPDHIKAVAEPVLAHRLVLREGMEFSVVKEELLRKVIQDTETPPWK